MNRFKKIIVCLMAVIMTAGLFYGCGAKSPDEPGNTQDEQQTSEKLSIVCTTFPQYDWIREIISGKQDRFELTLLLDSGTDLHNYQPTAEDMVKVSNCDMFVYVGGESDEWVDDALAQAVNKSMMRVNLMEALGDSVKQEETVEGMEAEEEEEEGEEEYDEHIWLSLKNARKLCSVLASQIGSLDSENKEAYDKNANDYIIKLSELDEQYGQAVENAPVKTILFADRFPFRYLADDYALTYYAAFSGCSAESEASFETVLFLSEKVDELGLKSVLTIEGSDGKIAQTVIDNTKTKDQTVVSLDSIQSVTSKNIEEGTTYLGIMESNLVNLKTALGV